MTVVGVNQGDIMWESQGDVAGTEFIVGGSQGDVASTGIKRRWFACAVSEWCCVDAMLRISSNMVDFLLFI